jgi:phenylalanyl-tRNA synthetase beta chain
VINLVAEQLVGAGFNEILNNSLTREAYYTDLTSYPADRAVRLMNPLSSDLSVMRQTLLFGGLETIAYNANRKRGNLRLFEQGNCYSFDADRHVEDKALSGYAEAEHLALWVTGNRVEGSWAHANEESTVYELKAYVMNIFSRLGLPFGAVVFGELKNDVFSKAVTVCNRGGKSIAQFGVVSKKQTKKLASISYSNYTSSRW